MDKATRSIVAKALRDAVSVLSAEVKITPKKWIDATLDDVKNDPKLADQLYKLVETAYTPLGGHLNIKNPQDLVNGEITLFHLKDEDGDGTPDAFLFSKDTKEGEKFVGLGHDGSKEAKQDVIKHQAEELKKPGHFCEVSEAVAHIFLTRYPDVPVVDKPELVEDALKALNPDEYREKHGKCPPGYNYSEKDKHCDPTEEQAKKPEKKRSIKWLGKDPEGKYPHVNGFYERTIGGKNVTKLLIGVPKTPKK